MWAKVITSNLETMNKRRKRPPIPRPRNKCLRLTLRFATATRSHLVETVLKVVDVAELLALPLGKAAETAKVETHDLLELVVLQLAVAMVPVLPVLLLQVLVDELTPLT